MKVVVFFFVSFLLSLDAFAGAVCIVDGRTYKYSDPMCSGPSSSGTPTAGLSGNQPNPACRVTKAKAQADLSERLNTQYPNSYGTQKLLLEHGLAAFNKLCQIPSDPISDGVLQKLFERYYPSYGAVLMLYEHEMESYKALHR